MLRYLQVCIAFLLILTLIIMQKLKPISIEPNNIEKSYYYANRVANELLRCLLVLCPLTSDIARKNFLY